MNKHKLAQLGTDIGVFQIQDIYVNLFKRRMYLNFLICDINFLNYSVNLCYINKNETNKLKVRIYFILADS